MKSTLQNIFYSLFRSFRLPSSLFSGVWLFTCSIHLVLFLVGGKLVAQVNHWETAINNDDVWKYFPGASQPPANWYQTAFNDAVWLSGQGGIGWADGDDNTIISTVNSLYLRRSFSVTDTSKIAMALLNMDYDDGFIAYLNGTEIARHNIGNATGDLPPFNQLANLNHEAEMHQNGLPEGFILLKNELNYSLKNGINVLAIQIANYTADDLSSNTWLSFGMKDPAQQFGPNPAWFVEPVLDSDRPIVMINTNGNTIRDDPKITAIMGIINNGPGARNKITDPFNEYNGLIALEIRGSATQLFPKKSFSLETRTTLGANNNVPLLGMPAENDWVLYAPYSDESLMRNWFMYNRFGLMGHYSVRTHYVDVYVNREYRGVYILMEKIKRDQGRIDIPELTPVDVAGDEVTGGYVLKVDWGTGAGGVGWTSPYGNHSSFRYHDPDQNELVPAQKTYIQSFVTGFEAALYGPNKVDPVLGYRPYIDGQSFVDFMVMQELAHNHDGYRASIYMHKDRLSNGGKLRMGPIWDFNMALGNAPFCNAADTAGWEHDYNVTCSGLSWFPDLFTDPHYFNAFSCRWQELRAGILHPDTIDAFFDSTAFWLAEAQTRNFERWLTLGIYTPWNTWTGMNYQEEVDFVKNYLRARGNWVDQNVIQNPVCRTTGQDLVRISEINYHSDPLFDAGDWFELYNTGPGAIDLSHWLFKDENPAHTFSFPAGTVLAAGDYLVVAQDTALFNGQHPGLPNVLGNFGFSLSNSSDQLHLFNENYMEMISMTYDDGAPWPTTPDGDGYTLEVLDPLDNLSDPNNWFAGCLFGSPGGPFTPPCGPLSISTDLFANGGFAFYPNPFSATTQLEISQELLDKHPDILLEISDLTGKVIRQMKGIQRLTEINKEELSNGIYIARLSSRQQLLGIRKLVIQ